MAGKVYYQNKKLIIRDAVFSDVELLAPQLRDDDREEILAMGQTPGQALLFSFKESSIVISIIHDGNIAAMFGIAPVSLMSEKAIIWLLTSPEIEKIKLTFFKLSKPFITMFLEYYPVLENRWVDARYVKTIQWLRRCGAEIYPSEFKGISGEEFYHAVFRRG